MRRRLLLLMVLWASRPLWALPPSSPYPGGVAIVPLPELPPAATILYDGYRVLTLMTPQGPAALVGIPLSATPGPAQLRITAPTVHELTFEIQDKAYPVQRLNVPPRMVDLDAATLARVHREQAELRAALKSWSNNAPPPDLRLDLPVTGTPSDSFGSRRLFNGQSRAPHSGMDIPALEGQPVRAPAAGRVLLTGDYFFNGKTLLLDHGQGFITLYCHLSEIDVTAGQKLARGMQVGKVGHSGRATGPHLHWGVSLNGSFVDPRLFIDMAQAASF